MKSLILILSAVLASAEISDLVDEFRIVGGDEAEPHSAPYIVSLLLKSRDKLVPFCGGSILNNRWILTAAHCLTVRPNRMFVGAGQHDVSFVEATAQIVPVSRYVAHSRFSDGIGPFDIGVIRLKTPLNFTEDIQPIAISQQNNIEGSVDIFGWGSTSINRTRIYPNILRTTSLTVVENSYCQSFFMVHVNGGNFCAGLLQEEVGGCVGDSGGPAVQDNALVGITSWGPISCDPEEGPSVFTKVWHYIKWIEDRVDGEIQYV